MLSIHIFFQLSFCFTVQEDSESSQGEISMLLSLHPLLNIVKLLNSGDDKGFRTETFCICF